MFTVRLLKTALLFNEELYCSKLSMLPHPSTETIEGYF